MQTQAGQASGIGQPLGGDLLAQPPSYDRGVSHPEGARCRRKPAEARDQVGHDAVAHASTVACSYQEGKRVGEITVASGHPLSVATWHSSGMPKRASLAMPDADAETLGKRIKLLRERAGLSQMDVAVGIGVARPQVTQYESGRKAPGREKVEQLSRLFGVTTDYILHGDLTKQHVHIETPDEARIILALRRASPGLRAAVETILREAGTDDALPAPPLKLLPRPPGN